ncbi:FAD-linked oxidase C-terminal domain-containing protein [Hyphomicrobium sp. CS1BSMeth3]|uniref:FAD-binding oxidoreductase n=1 Tax=Hyphomicrobium sp. CS1BSMeth3 TaxID=1892844 RepID=UPI0009312702|nr:FAD-linked oxidase C-terminal domain-containing protein [Hyphomicrobium sp. CS1BSMeth3]
MSETQSSGASDVATALAILRQRFGERFQTGEAVRRQHAHTLTWLPNQPPDAVVWPDNTEEVQDVVRIAGTHRVPIIPFGAGTSLEGHLNAPRGGISLDFSRMNRILTVNDRDLDATVEAGVSRKQLNDHLRDMGLFFPVDPGAEEATIGGMSATRASGTTAVRYGTMRENVLNVTAVMADGSVIRTARRARKSSAGYDLTKLFVGSEGTLGIMTEVTVKLYGIPESILSAVCPFESVEGACNSVIMAIQLGLGLARMELIDEATVRILNEQAKLNLPVKPMLFLEFHGTEAGTRDQVRIFEEIARGEGAIGFDWAEKEEDRRRLWKARHESYWSVKTAHPGREAIATDVCVPISRLAECVAETLDDIRASGLSAPIVGHVGDGNFHTMPMVDMSNPKEIAAAEVLIEKMAKRAIAMDGTCTGEHGVGQGKIKYLKAEHGPALAAMRAVKQALDPQNILNPGKILPAA